MNRREVLAHSGAGPGRTKCDRRPPRAFRWRAAGALLIAALANTACYHYVAISPATAPPNEEVRVRITRAAAARLAEDLGAYSMELDGTLSLRGQDSLAVAVPIVRKYGGMTLDSTSQLLPLGRSEVVDVRRREFSRGRTILTSAGVLAGFALLVHAVVQLTNPNPGSDEQLPPPPPAGSIGPSGRRLSVRIPLP